MQIKKSNRGNITVKFYIITIIPILFRFTYLKNLSALSAAIAPSAQAVTI